MRARCSSFAAALILALGSAGAVRAQGGIQQAQLSGQAQITSVSLSDPSPTETRAVLTFDQIIPQFSIITNNSEVAVLGFAGAKLGPAATVPTSRHGLLKSLSFTQNDTILTVTLNGAGPIHIVATPLGGRAVALSITSAQSAAAADKPSGPVAAHSDSGAPDDAFEVVPLRYADVSEIVGLLTANQGVKPNDTFTPQEPAFGSAGMSNAYSGGVSTPNFNNGGNPTAPGTDSIGQAADDTVGVDRRLNAIILRGPAARVSKLKEQILKLDVPVNSVVLETIFVELTEQGARNVGLNFNNANSQVATVAYQYAKGNSSTGSSSVGDTGRAGAVNVSLQAAIYAEIEKGRGRIISKPRIAAQSGSTAKIVTGDALPILTSIALSGVNAVSQQVQYVNVGVTLQIAPRVSDDGNVTSHVFAEVSSVTGYSQGYPTISQREASTSATVKDGESFIIGGLTQDTELSTHNKVPLAGDVPILGQLFRVENTTRSKTDLYIVVTPHIVRGRDEAAAAMVAAH